jgi:16S rRNA (uracil1498-N3)-methyltransferase
LRALFLQDLLSQDNYVIRDESLHHLVNVIRIEKDEELLLLNGKGFQVKTIVSEVHKRELRLSKTSELTLSRSYEIDLALGMPKREALELCLKEATELGLRRIFLVKSDYSHMRIPDEERLQNLLISALEQSNGAFLPEVIPTSWEEIRWSDYAGLMMLDSQSPKQNTQDSCSGGLMLVIGPEGGFSAKETSFLHQIPGMEVLHLPTPILRTPTAVATGTGLLLQRLLK